MQTGFLVLQHVTGKELEERLSNSSCDYSVVSTNSLDDVLLNIYFFFSHSDNLVIVTRAIDLFISSFYTK